MKCKHCGTEVWSDQGAYMHLEESDGTPHTRARCEAAEQITTPRTTTKMKVRMITARRFLLWLALGPRTYDYMSRVLREDARLRTCRLADIVVRKDGVEHRIEADWLKTLATIIMGRWEPAGGWPKPAPAQSAYAQNESMSLDEKSKT
jgi:hypothetical protein